MLRLILVLLFAFAASTAMAGDRLYKWTDDNGVVHYTAQPPENQQAEEFEIRNDRIPAPPPAPPEPVETVGSGLAPPEPPEREGPTDAELAQQTVQLCERGRYLLDVLVPRPNAVLTQPDGTVRAVTSDERLAYLEEGERLVSRYCD